MDFIELNQSVNGNRYALFLQDWPEVYAVANHKAEIVAECLVNLIWRYSVPMQIIHDHVAKFYLRSFRKLPN